MRTTEQTWENTYLKKQRANERMKNWCTQLKVWEKDKDMKRKVTHDR